jgi:two-component system chemotaxis sensor kinase CheA
MTAMPALAMQAGDATVLAPLDAVVATLRLREHELLRSPEGALVLHEGESVPFVPLAAVLRTRAPRRAPDHPWTIVLLRAGERTVALGVDRVHGISDVVIQALPPGVEAAPWIAGAVLDDEGNPVLLLDPPGLVQRAPRAMDASASEPPPRPPRPPVLVVDDSLTTRMLEQSILQSAGYEVDLACSGEEAMEKASARRYGLFIVDIEMPGMNGIDFTARTRADAALRAIPVILVTSLAAGADRERGIRAGAAAYIVKSEFDQRRFLQMVSELVE